MGCFGIDFEHSQNEHIWMKFDQNCSKWNVYNFPYNVCSSKDEFIFLQKCIKKSLKKYPKQLLNEIKQIVCSQYVYWMDEDSVEQIVLMFELYIIPYSMYDALIFESIHYSCANMYDSQECSSPESGEFMFAYQRSPC